MKFLVKAAASAIALALLATGYSAEQPQHKPTKPPVAVVKYLPDNRTLERHNGQPPVNDKQVDTTFEHATKVLDHLKRKFGRNSYDGKGSTLRVYISRGSENTSRLYASKWHWYHRCVYSDGNADLGTIAYVIAQGVVQAKTNEGESGESNESGAVARAIAEVLARGVDGSWSLGEPNTRDASNPRRNQLPAHVRQYKRERSIEATIHNSMILAHAIYLLENKVGADTTQQIVWTALTKHTKEGDGFKAFRNACRKAAKSLRGTKRSKTYRGYAVEEAFDKVGVTKSWKSPFDS